MKNKLKILYTAFNGKDNSSKILLDKLYSNNKLYLKNSFITSVRDLQKEIENNDYDLIISFGQAPLGKDTIKIELVGKLEKAYETHYNYEKIKNLLETKYKVIEIDYFDILYKEGIIGFIVYFTPVIYILIKIIKNTKLNFENVNNLGTLLLIFLIALFQGHIFITPQASIFISLLLVIIHNQILKKEESI